MTKERSAVLLAAMTDVREEYLEEAAAPLEKQPRRPVWILKAAVCCCALALAVGLALLKPWSWFGSRSNVKPGHRWPTRVVEITEENAFSSEASGVTTAEDWYGFERWEDLPGYMKYSSLHFKGDDEYGSYRLCAYRIKEEDLGEDLGVFTAAGWEYPAVFSTDFGEDIAPDPEAYQGVFHTLQVQVRAVAGVTSDWAVAVYYEEDDCWRLATTPYYAPQTLGALLEGVSFPGRIESCSALYAYFPEGERTLVQFDRVDSEKVLELLLSAPDAPFVDVWNKDPAAIQPFPYPADDDETALIELGRTLPGGIPRETRLMVYPTGYLIADLGPNSAWFYVGEEATSAFLRYLTEECDGAELEYVVRESDRSGAASVESYVATPEGTFPASGYGDSEGSFAVVSSKLDLLPSE